MAGELLDAQSADSAAQSPADVFSIGCLALECATAIRCEVGKSTPAPFKLAEGGPSWSALRQGELPRLTSTVESSLAAAHPGPGWTYNRSATLAKMLMTSMAATPSDRPTCAELVNMCADELDLAPLSLQGAAAEPLTMDCYLMAEASDNYDEHVSEGTGSAKLPMPPCEANGRTFELKRRPSLRIILNKRIISARATSSSCVQEAAVKFKT